MPFFVAALIYYSPQRPQLRWIAFVIFLLGAISDAVDGYIARKSRDYSKAGLVLDPLGDKLLLMSAFISLSGLSTFPVKFPLWVALVVISRDIIIILGAVVIYITTQRFDILPTRWGKLTTTSQMLAVIILLLQFDFAFVFWWIAIVFTLLSGFDYVRRGFKILYASDINRNTN